VGEQNRLLEEMLARAEGSVKELGERLGELQGRQDAGSLEGAVLETVSKLGANWLGLILSAWAAALAREAGTRRPGECGEVARWGSARGKTILPLLGKVSSKRMSYHCPRCHQGEGSGDRAWGPMGTRTSLALRQLLAYLSATTVGFATVARDVGRVMHWPERWLSGKQVQRLAEPIGARRQELDAAKVARWGEARRTGVAAEGALAAPSPTKASDPPAVSPERLYVEMDGIFARLRGAGGKGSDVWREVKVGAVFWAEPGRRAAKLAALVGSVRAKLGQSVRVWVDRPGGPIRYVATLRPAERFGVRRYAEAVVRGMERAVEVVVLGDGARWIWDLAAEHFPDAIPILDFHHAQEWVGDVAHAVWGHESAAAKAWAAAQIDQHLIRGDAHGLIAAIAALPPVDPPAGDSKSLPDQAREYFRTNAERMRYPIFRARGLEIGSGISESSGRRVVGVRCKQPGMRWSEEGLSAIVDRRAHVLSHRFDAVIADLPLAA
jgi:hypothetical protein